MGTYRMGVFPSLNNKMFQDDIAYDISNYFVKMFPPDFFNSVFIDTLNGNYNKYTVNENGEMIKVENTQRKSTPYIRINIRQGKNNREEIFGGFSSVHQQPGAFGIEPTLSGYKPFLIDPYNIILASNDCPIRNTIELTISLQTRQDQMGILNFIDTNIKRMYGYVLESEPEIILPNLLMSYLRSCIFKKEIKYIDMNDILSEKEKKDEMKIVNQQFLKHMYDYSNGAIKAYKYKDENTSDVLFALKRRHRIYLKWDESIEMDDGEKRGNVYDGFKITLNGYFDYANPVSFITSVPAIVRGSKNNTYILTSSNKSKQLYYSTMSFKEMYKEERKMYKPIEKPFVHFYLERELMMSSKTENFNLLDDIIDKNRPQHYKIVEYMLNKIKTKKEFDETFKVVIFKDKSQLFDDEFSVDEKFNFTIENCDLTVPYYIDIYINKNKLELEIEKDSFKHESNFMPNEYNTRENIVNLLNKLSEENNFNYITGIMTQEYKKVLLIPDEKVPYLIETDEDGYVEVNGLKTFETYLTRYEKIDNEYIEIDKFNIDSQKNYYIKDIYNNYHKKNFKSNIKYNKDEIYYKKDKNNNYIQIELKDFQPYEIYYIKKNDEYISVSLINTDNYIDEFFFYDYRNKKYQKISLIPDKNTEYYIRNKEKQFILVGKLTKFNKNTNYYYKRSKIIHGYIEENISDPDDDTYICIDGYYFKKHDVKDAIHKQYQYGIVVYDKEIFK